MSKYTPGPWQPFTPIPDPELESKWQYYSPQLCDNHDMSIDEAQANAILISRAPEMFELLQKINSIGETPYISEKISELNKEIMNRMKEEH